MKKTICLLFMSYMFIGLFAQTEEQVRTITQNYDFEKINKLKTDLLKYNTEQLEKAYQLANINGWPIYKENPNGGIIELVGVTKDGAPLYYTTTNVDAAHSTRTDQVHSGGGLGLDLNGQDMNIFVWDEGTAYLGHEEFDGPGGDNRVIVMDDANGSLHGGHVIGTLIAYGADPQAKGMAPYANARSYDWGLDIYETLNAATIHGMLVSNHSYGYFNGFLDDWYFGAYIYQASLWDQVMYDAPYYLMVTSAGNDGDFDFNGNPLQPGMDQLTGLALVKNNLVVANVLDVIQNEDGTINPEEVVLNSSSSIGPADDLRIKPDIAGNGTDVYSTANNVPDGGYASLTGTSMSCPNVSGSLLLLQEHYQNLNGNFLRAASLKGLALHTADLLGDGPNSSTGWGLLNTKRAVELISTDPQTTRIRESILEEGQTQNFTFIANGDEPLNVSISWTDPVGQVNEGTVNPNYKTLVNDLDVRVTDDGNIISYPWKLGNTGNGLGPILGDNNSDPYERVDIENPTTGVYEVSVSHKGNLFSGQQAYTLIVSGATEILSDIISISLLDEEDLALDVQCGEVHTIGYKIKDGNCVLDQLGGNSVETVKLQLDISMFGNLVLLPGDGVTSFDEFGQIEIPNDLIDEQGTIVTATFEVDGDISGSFTNLMTVSLHPGNYTVYSCNSITSEITQSPICYGDINGDGAINSADLTLFLTVYGQSVPECHAADFDGDGVIKSIDLAAFLSVFGTFCEDNLNENNQDGAFTEGDSDDLGELQNEKLRSILSENVQNKIDVYPNPGTGIFHIKGIEQFNEGAIEIFDLKGAKILNIDLGDDFENSINLSAYEDGMYVLKYTSGSKVINSFIIKTN